MSDFKNIILRVQGPEGTVKIQISTRDCLNDVIKKIESNYPKIPSIYRLWKDAHNDEEIFAHGKPHNFVDGQKIFIEFTPVRVEVGENQNDYTQRSLNCIEDDVDKIIEANPGIIHREKTDLCLHSSGVKCLKCMDVEIFEDRYLKDIEPPLKHVSFHVYLRQKLSGNKSKFIAPLDEIRCNILPDCKNHAPYPAGICSQCQPSSLTLKLQEFRHIDNIMFENHEEVDTFIGFWRKTMCQRIGFLYGTYEPFDNIPLGIRASIHAIYEPPQTNTFDFVKLLEDPHREVFDICANAMGYRRVGWILTDLLIDPKVKGSVLQTRSSETYHLSAQECITAAAFQNSHLNPCKYSPSGFFGSKFVTVIVTGNSTGNIDFYGWQVSNQCMALVRDGCLLPTVDDPSLAYVRDSNNQKYVPDVFYQGKDEFDNSVVKIARPVPVDYFLVDIPAGFPINAPESPKISKSKFPSANREVIREKQSFNSFTDFLNNPIPFLKNIHMISFLYSNLDKKLQEFLLMICRLNANNEMQDLTYALSDYQFIRIKEIISQKMSVTPINSFDSSMSGRIEANNPINENSNSASFTEWTCPVCTFINKVPSFDDEGFPCCEICRIPK